ncbi:MAG: alpha/beta hydrolase [Hyphomicrobiales bacterium]
MSRPRTHRLSGALAVMLLAGLLAGFMDLSEFKVYLPDELPRREPAWSHGAPRIVTTVTEDGLTLSGRFWPARDPASRRIIVFFHGNKGHVVKAAQYAEGLRRTGAAVLVADYRGYSDNPGSPSEAGLFADGRAFIALAREMGYAPEDTFVVGLSLGSAVSLYVAGTEPIAGVIVMSAFTRLDDLVPKSVAKRMEEHFDNLSRVPSISVPKVFVQGTFDAVVDPDHGRRLFLAAHEPAALFVLDHVFHRPPMTKAARIVAAAIEAMAAGNLSDLKALEDGGMSVFIAPEADVPSLAAAGSRAAREGR